MPAGFANITAATTAGYKEVVTDRGAAYNPAGQRFYVLLEKPIVGESGASGGVIRAHGEGANQTAAEAVALAALNTQRNHRYGGAPGRADADASSNGPRGGTLTADQN